MVSIKLYNRCIAKDVNKVEEHDRLIEKLEEDKHTLVKNKNFKEAGKTKDLINLKVKKKNNVLQEIEDFKAILADSEKKLQKAKNRQKELIDGSDADLHQE